jgi:hypothetical protein
LIYDVCADADAESDAEPVAETDAEDAPIQELRNKKSREKKKILAPSVPLDVSPAVWDAFVEMRKKIRKPLTERAAALIGSKLQCMKQAGFIPDEVLDQSIRNSWQDVFPIKEVNLNSDGVKSFEQMRSESTDRAPARVLEGYRQAGD